ncbi:MAG: recombinase family protein [Clostridia bacterium]|nr:recombinase family protein [Clostridia bacterium]
MKTAVIYARYSSDSQSEQSIEGQLRVCEEYAQRNNILILNTYIDRAMTGTNDNRPDFQKMLKDSNRKEWNYVLVYKLDRFSRNKYESTIHKKTLKNNGVTLLSAMENIPDTPEGIILESLLEGMNQYFSAELSQKVRRGMKETRLKGNFTGGYILYGYNVENRKVVINENQAEVVRYIFEQYSLGVFVKDIMKSLTAKGIYNHGKPFARNTVYNILKNEKYSGIYRHNGEVFENMYPQIVPTEIYEKVRAKINENQYGKRSVEVVYLLRHKLKCGYCGQPISAETGTSKNGQVKRYYKCLGRKRQNGCQKSMIGKDYLENLIIATTIDELSKPQNMNSLVKGLLKIQEQQSNGTPILNLLTKEKRQTENAINNIMTAIEKGVITNTTTKRLKELEEQQENLERQILIERSKTAVKLTERDIREYYEQSLKLEPQMLINFLINEILLFDDKIEIHYNSPIKISPDDENNQGFIFYSKTIKLNSIQNIIVIMQI